LGFKSKSWITPLGLILAVLVYTQARYWLVDATLLGSMCAYTLIWASRHYSSCPTRTQSGPRAIGRTRSRVLYYARLRDLKRGTQRSVSATVFEQRLFEALSSTGSLDGALDLVTSRRFRIDLDTASSKGEG